MYTLVRNLGLASLLSACVMTGAGPSEGSFKGILIDKMCSSKADLRITPNGLEGGMIVAEAHERECLLMPACIKSGYGVLTFSDHKFLAFDAEGNRQALAAIKASKKLVDFEVEVSGDLNGETLRVKTLKLQ